MPRAGNGLPEVGLDPEELFERLEAFREDDLDWRAGRTFAYVYDAGREAEAVAARAYASWLSENALDPTVFPSVMRLENALVRLAGRHLGGGDAVAGNFTTGGTESILLAVKAARDRARVSRPSVTRPEIVLPTTAHAAFHKAAWYLDLRPVTVDVDPVSFRAGADEVAPAVTDRTVLLVGSAPSYPHGVIDDIPGLAALARDRGLPLHVDACVGGWLLPYFRRAGAEVPPFDFSVPGVTSMSVDLHKYAFCPKGASLVLHRDAALREHQIFACSGWTGYTIVNPTVLSSRSAAPMAAAWATLHFIGDGGYLSHARAVLEATRAIVEGVSRIPGLRVMGRPDFCLVAVASDEVDIFQVIDEMKARAWYLQPQLGHRGSRENLHISVNPGNAARVDEMLRDLRDATEAARGLPPSGLGAMVRGALEGVSGEAITDEAFEGMLAMAGIVGTALPERMAPINDVLNALPPELKDRVLTWFFNRLNQEPAGP